MPVKLDSIKKHYSNLYDTVKQFVESIPDDTGYYINEVAVAIGRDPASITRKVKEIGSYIYIRDENNRRRTLIVNPKQAEKLNAD